jgi:ribosomal-protein-alanine N-acetyltransferase
MTTWITSPRLDLRPLTMDDAAEFYRLNADEEVMRYVPDIPFFNLGAARDFITNYLQVYKTGFGRLAMINKEDNTFIGWCGLKYHPAEDVVDLGYRLHHKYWGKGYATEAGLACLKHGFERQALNRIIGHAARDNKGSRRVLEKVGMAYVGPFKENDWHGVAYEITRQRYEKQKTDAKPTR